MIKLCFDMSEVCPEIWEFVPIRYDGPGDVGKEGSGRQGPDRSSLCTSSMCKDQPETHQEVWLGDGVLGVSGREPHYP